MTSLLIPALVLTLLATAASCSLSVSKEGGDDPYAGRNVTLRCTFSGPLGNTQEDHFRWMNESADITESARVHVEDYESHSFLHIYSISEADQATYFCYHENAPRAEYHLPVEVLPSFVEPVVLEQSFPAGSNALVRCRANAGTHGIMLWGKDFNTLGPRFNEQLFGILEIGNIQPEDAGEYMCTLKHNGNRGTRVINVTVTTGSEEAPVIHSLDDVLLSLNDTLSLNCSADGDGVSFEWRKLPEGTFTGSELSIPAAELQNGDSFVCTASNDFGSAEEVVTVWLRVAPLPQLYFHSLITRRKGEMETLTPLLDETRRALDLNYTWNHTPLEAGQPMEVLQERSRLLTLENLTTADAGNYTLNVCNQFGCSVQHYKLVVEEEVVFKIQLTSEGKTCEDIMAQYNARTIEMAATMYVSQNVCSCDVFVQVEMLACDDSTTLAVSAKLIGARASAAREQMEAAGQWPLVGGDLEGCVAGGCQPTVTTPTVSVHPPPQPFVIAISVVIATLLLVLIAAVLTLLLCRRRKHGVEGGDEGRAEKGDGGLETTQPSPHPPPPPAAEPQALDPHVPSLSNQHQRPQHLALQPAHPQHSHQQLIPLQQQQHAPLQQTHAPLQQELAPSQQRHAPLQQQHSHSPMAYIRCNSLELHAQFTGPA